jgi:hypothetical protein
MTQIAGKLGIALTTDNNFQHVLGIARAAKHSGRDVDVFITGEGVHSTRDPEFTELLEFARVGICEVSYFARGYKGISIPGLRDKDFVTQGRNAELVDDSDRYIVL